MSDLPATDTSDLAAHGEERLTWVRARMRLLAGVRSDFEERLPFRGMTIGVGLHIEPKTAVLLETLAAGGAKVRGTGNHGSTQDDVVAALAAKGIPLFGTREDSLEAHVANLHRTLDEARRSSSTTAPTSRSWRPIEGWRRRSPAARRRPRRAACACVRRRPAGSPSRSS
jgi:S-adenosylhomocysteine hydrolase